MSDLKAYYIAYAIAVLFIGAMTGVFAFLLKGTK